MIRCGADSEPKEGCDLVRRSIWDTIALKLVSRLGQVLIYRLQSGSPDWYISQMGFKRNTKAQRAICRPNQTHRGSGKNQSIPAFAW